MPFISGLHNIAGFIDKQGGNLQALLGEDGEETPSGCGTPAKNAGQASPIFPPKYRGQERTKIGEETLFHDQDFRVL